MQTQQPQPQMDSQALARARYLAYAQRRTMPPRCNPFGILILVLSLGMIFIGLTMTIIANWPGATSIGENPLRVAGPVLLAVGGAIFVLGVVLAVCLNQREQTKWELKFTTLAAARFGNSSREILVQRPEATNENPYKAMSTDSSRGSGAYPLKERYSSSTVEMLPDPTKKNSLSGKFHDVSLDSEDRVPDPMRVQKKRLTPSRKSDSSNASVNHSYSSGAGEADLGVPGMLFPSPHASQPGSRHNGAYSNAVCVNTEALDAGGKQRGPDRHGKAEEGRGGRHPVTVGSDPIREAIARGTAQVYASDQQLQQQQVQQQQLQQQLRVHIRAQPGTAVHITPSSTPPHSRLSYQRPGRTQLDTSGETEI